MRDGGPELGLLAGVDAEVGDLKKHGGLQAQGVVPIASRQRIALWMRPRVLG